MSTREDKTAHGYGMDTPHPAPHPRRDLSHWWARYDRVASHAHLLGRLPRLSDHVDPADVGWPASQRRATTLDTDQRAALAALPGWSDHPRADSWEQRAEELRVFIATHHRAPRVRGDMDGESALAHWHSRQRVADTQGRLTTERSRALRYATRALRSAPE